MIITKEIAFYRKISYKKQDRASRGNLLRFDRTSRDGIVCISLSQYRNISLAVTISRTKMDRGTWNMVIRLI